jgi:hypothetical protein
MHGLGVIICWTFGIYTWPRNVCSICFKHMKLSDIGIVLLLDDLVQKCKIVAWSIRMSFSLYTVSDNRYKPWTPQERFGDALK